ncbi:MAG: hypothetical protein IT167_04130 [Bryobacterales bacterium]|nr:hypothetical protein [Bryobacterales bacterium]
MSQETEQEREQRLDREALVKEGVLIIPAQSAPEQDQMVQKLAEEMENRAAGSPKTTT